MVDEIQGQEPNAGGQEPQAGTGEPNPPETFDAAYVKQLRQEAAEYRKKLRELEAKAKADDEAKLSEAERLQKKLAELELGQAERERERQERTVKYEIRLAAQKMGVIDDDAAYRLLDPAALEFDDDGMPTNTERVLKDLIARRPYLVGGGSSSAANPVTQRAGRLTLEDVKKMSQDEINKRWEEVSAVLEGKS